MDEPKAHLVFLASRVLLAKRPGASWREIQDEFDDYKTSIGPWTADQIAGEFAADYGEDDRRWPFSRATIAGFLASGASEVEVSDT